MKIIKIADLHCTLAGADKVYCAALIEGPEGYTVDFAYGRRNSTLTRGTKTTSPLPQLAQAETLFEKLVREKAGKGYVDVPGVCGVVFAGQMEEGCSAAVQTASAALDGKVKTGIYPQLLNAVSEEEAERLIADPLWGAMPKLDGRRQMARLTDGKGVIGINRKGFVVPLAPAVASSVMGMGRPILLDGEAIGDRLHCFGILEYDGLDLRGMPYVESYRYLQDALETHTGYGLELVPLAVTTEEKRELYARLKDEKAEGIVFKRLDISYSPDRPSSGGPHLKRKFVESASVIVLDVNNKRSVKMGVYHPGESEPTFVGNVTIPANFDIPQPGDIIEVEYLYVYRGGKIFQPVYKGIRDDIDPRACTKSQLKYCTKTAEDAA